MMIPAVLEKATYGFATVVLYLAGRLAAAVLAFGQIDLTLGVLFAIAYVRTAPRPAYSVLDGSAWAAAGLTPLRPWREALHAALSTTEVRG